jgi:hypothetical protein
MYIYDRKFLVAQSLLKEQPVTSRPAQRNSYYPDRGISRSLGGGGGSGSYLWTNEGFGELSDGKFKLYPAGKFYGFLKEKSFLRNADLKTKQTVDGKELFYPDKQMVDILGQKADWLLVKGQAMYKGNGIDLYYSEHSHVPKLEGWVKKSWVDIRQSVPITKPAEREMKFELQTSNFIRRTDGENKKWLPRKFGTLDFLHKGIKGKPAQGGKEGTAIELQSETGGFVEFETPKWFRNWCELKERIQEAVDMVNTINVLPGYEEELIDKKRSDGTPMKARIVKFPFDIKHLKKTKTNPHGLTDKEYLEVAIVNPNWKTRIQVSEAIELPQYESLLKEHEVPSLVTSTLDSAQNILNIANTATLPASSLVNLLSFLQIIVNYILRGQRISLKIDPSKRHPAKFAFQLMCRTSFSSIFRFLLSPAEQAMFRQIVDKKLILNKLGLADSSQFFIHGHGTSKTKPTVSMWLKSILRPIKDKDLLSFSRASRDAGGFNGSEAMGRFDVKTITDTVRFEVRGSVTHGDARGAMIQPSSDWVCFAEKVFRKAFTDRKSKSSRDLNYDPSRCPPTCP